MKKTLIALAALAAGTAFAQSSVTLYGRVDMSLAHTTNDATGLVSGFNSPSVFGLKGSEDLGGGLKANFGLESSGFDSTGSLGSGALFGRAAWVGVSGGFGEVKLGRKSSLATDSQAGFDLEGVSDASAMVLTGLSPVVWYGSSRRSSQLVYITPNLSGVDAALSYITSGDNATISGPTSNGAREALRVNYAAGPIAAGFVAESASTATNRTAYALAGSYDFGVAKAVIGWDRSENAAVTNAGVAFNATPSNTASTFGQEAGQGYYLGVSAPFGATTVGAQYANNTAVGIKALELFANYSLSKRTFLYVDAANVTSSALLSSNINRYAVGVQTNF